MRRVAKKAALILLAALALVKLCAAATVTVSGAWALTIGSGNLQGGAGSNLTATYVTPAGQITMSVTGNSYHTWSVSVARVDSTWNANFVLSIERTGSGTGTGTISGGTTYLAILTTSQVFVTGRLSLTGIPLLEQLSGVSVSIPPATYATTIQFTAADTS